VIEKNSIERENTTSVIRGVEIYIYLSLHNGKLLTAVTRESVQFFTKNRFSLTLEKLVTFFPPQVVVLRDFEKTKRGKSSVTPMERGKKTVRDNFRKSL